MARHLRLQYEGATVRPVGTRRRIAGICWIWWRTWKGESKASGKSEARLRARCSLLAKSGGEPGAIVPYARETATKNKINEPQIAEPQNNEYRRTGRGTTCAKLTSKFCGSLFVNLRFSASGGWVAGIARVRFFRCSCAFPARGSRGRSPSREIRGRKVNLEGERPREPFGGATVVATF